MINMKIYISHLFLMILFLFNITIYSLWLIFQYFSNKHIYNNFFNFYIFILLKNKKIKFLINK